MDVNSGTFNERIKKLVKFGIKHVKQCPVSPSAHIVGQTYILVLAKIGMCSFLSSCIVVFSERFHL